MEYSRYDTGNVGTYGISRGSHIGNYSGAGEDNEGDYSRAISPISDDRLVRDYLLKDSKGTRGREAYDLDNTDEHIYTITRLRNKDYDSIDNKLRRRHPIFPEFNASNYASALDDVGNLGNGNYSLAGSLSGEFYGASSESSLGGVSGSYSGSASEGSGVSGGE